MSHNIVNIIELTNAPTPPRWFEFLLEPGRLHNHLEENCCDPTPYQLILSFLRNSPNLESTNLDAPLIDKASPTTSLNGESEVHIPPDSYEAKYRIRKAYALQTLAIKVASFLGWDLDAIANHLSLPIQHKLMLALTSACSAEACPPEVKKYTEILYDRWFLRSSITYQLSALQPQTNNTTMIYLSQLQQQQQAAETSALSNMAELFAPTSKQLRNCANELREFFSNLASNGNKGKKNGLFGSIKLSRPRIDCFDHRDVQYNNWLDSEPIEVEEFLEAACYDLGRFFFFEESYSMSKDTLDMIMDVKGKFPLLKQYLKSATDLLDGKSSDMDSRDEPKRNKTERYLFNCMTRFRDSQSLESTAENAVEEGEIQEDDEDFEDDSDMRFEQQLNSQRLPDDIAWYLQVPNTVQQQILLEAARGDLFMSQGNFKQAMGCFVGTLMLMTDYFNNFSKDYADEEPYISRMIQCSISLSCFTQAVALCQMNKTLNYTIAFKQLNERICNDCCDDIYECIWNVTLLEYIINLHARRGEVERRSKVIQLIGQLELNENNPEEILREAEHVRRSRFFRIMSNKYL